MCFIVFKQLFPCFEKKGIKKIKVRKKGKEANFEKDKKLKNYFQKPKNN